MPAYASHVLRMTTGSVSERSAGLASLRCIINGLPEEVGLEVVNEPGLLTAVNAFLSGSESLTALVSRRFAREILAGN